MITGERGVLGGRRRRDCRSSVHGGRGGNHDDDCRQAAEWREPSQPPEYGTFRGRTDPLLTGSPLSGCCQPFSISRLGWRCDGYGPNCSRPGLRMNIQGIVRKNGRQNKTLAENSKTKLGSPTIATLSRRSASLVPCRNTVSNERSGSPTHPQAPEPYCATGPPSLVAPTTCELNGAQRRDSPMTTWIIIGCVGLVAGGVVLLLAALRQ